MPGRLIVTGGAGFIGCNLIAELNRRGADDILVVDHLDDALKKRNLETLSYSDYMDKTEFRERLRAGKIEPVKAVFHLGACSATTETDEAYLEDNNFRYTRELCEWCLERDTRFVYASSAATYGDGSLGYCDDDRVTPGLRPLNGYGRSKQKFDLWAMEQGVLDHAAGLKYFNVYGPHEDHKGDMRSVVNKAYAQVLETGEIGLFRSYRPEYADGEQERDFVYVADVVRVTLFFFEHPEVCGLFNCGTGTARTWLDLAHAVFAAMNREPAISFVDMPEALRGRYQYHTCADVSKLRRAGYDNAFTTIEDGVREYVQGYLATRPSMETSR